MSSELEPVEPVEFTWYKYAEDLENATIAEMDRIGSGFLENGDELDPHFVLRSERLNSTLKINDVVYEDRFIYKCIAK